VFSKKMPKFAIQKKQLKLTIMTENKTSKKRNYRITIIFRDEITIEKFETEFVAIETVKKMKILFPNIFIGGVVEEKCKSWRVIWALGNK
jgi:hypothetical protein